MNISILRRRPQLAVEKLFDEPRPGGDAGGASGLAAQVKERLWQRMARECEVMMRYALSTSRAIPVEVIERLEQAVSPPDVPVAIVTPDQLPADAVTPGAPQVVTSQFALLAAAHAGLAFAIAPATPEAVRLMADERERHPVWCQFGPLPLVRQMLGLALLSLVTLLGVSVSAVVNTANTSKSIFELSGYPLLGTCLLGRVGV